jgi:hypothetical protein
MSWNPNFKLLVCSLVFSHVSAFLKLRGWGALGKIRETALAMAKMMGETIQEGGTQKEEEGGAEELASQIGPMIGEAEATAMHMKWLQRV